MNAAVLATVEGLEEFLAVSAVSDRPLHETIAEVGERLHAAFGVARLMIGWRLLNPLFDSQTLYWRPETGVLVERWRLSDNEISDEYTLSPIAALLDREDTEIRARLDRANAPFEFPILDDLAQEGFTDYLIVKQGFGGGPSVVMKEVPGTGVILSFVSEREGGFSDEEVCAMRRLQYMLSIATRSAMDRDMRETLAATYLGEVAGRRVLQGEISRGTGQPVDAVIWYCDMRGSTALCERLGVSDYLPVLNAYFSATAGPVRAAGGNVLDFIGDAVLATFPLTDDGIAAALRGTADALAALEDLRVNEPAFSDRSCVADMTGIAIATGTVVYGNIGIPERLTFSVIGPTVNAVARLENLTKQLGEPVLATADVEARLRASVQMRALGTFLLPGRPTPQTIFAPVLHEGAFGSGGVT